MNPLVLTLILKIFQEGKIGDDVIVEELKEFGVSKEMINEFIKIKNSTSKRQSDPKPIEKKVEAPSLILYSVLFLIAFGLVLSTFMLDKPDWSALLLNLSTEIIGAIILIIVIDKRYRQEEVSELKTKTYDIATNIRYTFSPDLRFLINYSKAIGEGILKGKPELYVGRKELEELCLSKMRDGYYLYGMGGIGKTTLLQMTMLFQIKNFLISPRREILPILIPVRNIEGKRLLSEIVEETSLFKEISEGRLMRLLKKNKILLVFDGLDEAKNPDKLHEEIFELNQKYNHFPIVISSRREFSNTINQNKIILSDLTQQESFEFIRRRAMYDSDAE